MAAALPALVGAAGGSAATATTVGSLLSYAGTAVSAFSALQSFSAGRQQAASYKFQAMQQDLSNRTEKVKAKEAENEARRRFISTLSSTQAAFSARGVNVGVGTPQGALIDIAGESARDLGALKFNTDMGFMQGQAQSQQYRMAGKQASTQGIQQGLSGLGNLFVREFSSTGKA